MADIWYLSRWPILNRFTTLADSRGLYSFMLKKKRRKKRI
jgi:hypothetical protein